MVEEFIRRERLELQQLQFDFQEVGLAHVSDAAPLGADVHGLLEAIEILLRKLKRRFGEQNVHKLLRQVKDELAFVVGDLGPDNGRLVAGGLQAMLPFPASLEEVADTGVKLCRLVNVFGIEFVRLEDRQELRVEPQRGIWPQIGGDLFGQALLDRGAQRLQRVVVQKREPDCVVKRYARGSRRRRGGLRRYRILLANGKRRQKGQNQHERITAFQEKTPHPSAVRDRVRLALVNQAGRAEFSDGRRSSRGDAAGNNEGNHSRDTEFFQAVNGRSHLDMRRSGHNRTSRHGANRAKMRIERLGIQVETAVQLRSEQDAGQERCQD